MNIKKAGALSAALSLLAGVAFAQTIDLGALLNQFLSWLQQNPQIVQQVAQVVGTQVQQAIGVPSACVGVTFTRNLSLGMSGADVKCLQALLNKDPDTQVAVTGPGSPGNETSYFGPKTRAAVIKFQEKYRDEILTPVGLTAGTGYVGPKTRAKLNALLSEAQVTLPSIPIQPEQPTPTPTPTPPEEEVVGEEGALSVRLSPSPSGVTVYEGEQNKAVVAFVLKAKDSEITVQRIDVKFTKPAGYTGKVYKLLSYAALYDGENAIKGVSLSSDTVDSEGKVRFSGLNIVVPKDGEKTITVRVSAASTLDATGTVTVTVDEDYVRGVDTARLPVYNTGKAERHFTLAKAKTPTVRVALNSTASPKEGIAIVDKDSDTEVTLAVFDLKAKDADAKVTKLKFAATGTGADLVNGIYVYDGDNAICSETPDTSGVVSCEDLEVTIAENTTKSLTVKALINHDFGSVGEGGKVKVSLTDVSWEDKEGNEYDATSSVESKLAHLYHAAPEITLASSGSSKVAKNNYEVTLSLKVTAKGEDIYLKKGTTSDDWLNVEAPSGADPSYSYAVVSASGAEEVTVGGEKYFKVSEGASASLTLKVNIVLASTSDSGYYSVSVDAVSWHAEGQTSDTTWTPTNQPWLADLKIENVSCAYES